MAFAHWRDEYYPDGSKKPLRNQSLVTLLARGKLIPGAPASENMNIICSTCMEGFKSNSDISSTMCGHVFHTQCITKWLDTAYSYFYMHW